jgi:hypothetical protein
VIKKMHEFALAHRDSGRGPRRIGEGHGRVASGRRGAGEPRPRGLAARLLLALILRRPRPMGLLYLETRTCPRARAITGLLDPALLLPLPPTPNGTGQRHLQAPETDRTPPRTRPGLPNMAQDHRRSRPAGGL